MKPTLLILAAGMGSRYGGVKQIDPVGPNGEIIIDYSIYDAIRAGFEKMVMVIRKDIEEDIREKFDPLQDRIEVEYAFQEIDLPEEYPEVTNREKPWGTAHAVLAAKNHIQDPFAVINADDYYGPQAYELAISFFRKNHDQFCYQLVGYQLEKTLSDHGSVSRGIGITDEEDFLISIKEHHGVRKDGERILHTEEGEEKELQSRNVSMNFWGFYPSIFPEIEAQFRQFVENNRDNPKAEFYIPLVIDELINTNKASVKVMKTDAQWYGVTYREDKPLVERGVSLLVREGLYPTPLWG